MTKEFDGLRKSIGALAGKVRELRKQIETKRREREDLLAAPPCKADVLQMLCGWIDRNAQAATKSLDTMLAGFFRKPDYLSDDAVVARGVALLAAVPDANVAPTLKTAEVMLSALFADHLKQALPGLLDRVSWPAEPGLPIAERTERVAAIDRELEALEDSERELVAQATDAGINLSGVYYA